MKIENINFSVKESITISIEKQDNSSEDITLWLDECHFLNIVDTFGEDAFVNFRNYFKPIE